MPRDPDFIKKDVIYILFKSKIWIVAAKLKVLACAPSVVELRPRSGVCRVLKVLITRTCVEASEPTSDGLLANYLSGLRFPLSDVSSNWMPRLQRSCCGADLQ